MDPQALLAQVTGGKAPATQIATPQAIQSPFFPTEPSVLTLGKSDPATDPYSPTSVYKSATGTSLPPAQASGAQPFDNTTAGIALNTVKGIPLSALKVFSDIVTAPLNRRGMTEYIPPNELPGAKDQADPNSPDNLYKFVTGSEAPDQSTDAQIKDLEDQHATISEAPKQPWSFKDLLPQPVKDALYGTLTTDGQGRQVETKGLFQTIFPGIAISDFDKYETRKQALIQAGDSYDDAVNKAFSLTNYGQQNMSLLNQKLVQDPKIKAAYDALDPDEQKAVNGVAMTEGLNKGLDSLNFTGVGSIEAKSAAEIIAQTSDKELISKTLQSEIPQLDKQSADSFSHVFQVMDNPQQVETSLNRIKYQAQQGAEDAAHAVAGETKTPDQVLQIATKGDGQYVIILPEEKEKYKSAENNSTQNAPESRFQNGTEIIDYIARKGAGYGAPLNVTEMRQLARHLVEQGGDSIVNSGGSKMPRGTIYKSYGGGKDVVLANVNDPRFGRSVVVGQLNKAGKLDGRFRTHFTSIEPKDIIGKINDDELMAISSPDKTTKETPSSIHESVSKEPKEVLNDFITEENPPTSSIEEGSNKIQDGVPDEARLALDTMNEEKFLDKTFEAPTAKPVPEKPQYSSELENRLHDLTTERDIKIEAIRNHPAKDLVKYVSKSTGRLPEITGKPQMRPVSGRPGQVANSYFGMRGDTIISQNGYHSGDEASLGIDQLQKTRKDIVQLNKMIKKARQDVVDAKASERDAKSLNHFLNTAFGKTEAERNATIKRLVNDPESFKSMKIRGELARKRLQGLMKASYHTVSPLERETPLHLLQLTKEAYSLTPEEFERMGDDDPYKEIGKISVDTSTPLKNKINLWDTYMSTPDRVLRKIGLGRFIPKLRHAEESYYAELAFHMDVLENFKERFEAATVGGNKNENNKQLFRGLNGEKASLAPKEKVIQKEIEEYLKDWADRFQLPDDKRITHYITHIFGVGENEKEFDEDLAKIIHDKLPKEVYDPFLEKRLGKKGYIEDTWRALEAYIKRGVRKANFDPVLKEMEAASKNLEQSQLTYVKRFIENVNLRPSEIDTQLDNWIKQYFGYRFGVRPTAYLTRLARRWVSRAALGLNVGSALRNLTQGVNTYAKLGEKYTTIGYMKLLQVAASPELREELRTANIFGHDVIQDKELSVVRKLMQNVDKGLYSAFQTAEFINRGSAYLGAKAKALAEGKTELQAMEYAKQLVRDTQFSFSAIDMPVGLNSDIARTLAQFLTYAVKQTEFGAEMLRDAVKSKKFGGILRYIVGSILVLYTVGKALNIKASDQIPGATFFTGNTKLGKPPILDLGQSIMAAILNSPNDYGQIPTWQQKMKNILQAVPVPAMSQGLKTYKGATAYFSPTSNLVHSPANLLKAVLLGPSNIDTKQDQFKPTYDKITQLINSGQTDAAQKLVDGLSDADYKLFKKMQQSDKAKQTKQFEVEVTPIFNQIHKLDQAGDTAGAQKILDSMSDAQYHAYQLLNKQAGY